MLRQWKANKNRDLLSLLRFIFIMSLILMSTSFSVIIRVQGSSDSILKPFTEQKATEKIVEQGDVCEIKWNLTLDGTYYNKTQKKYYIGDVIPSTLKKEYRGLEKSWFYEEVIGLEVGNTFTFSRADSWTFNNFNPTDPAAGADITVRGIVEKMMYDKSEDKFTISDIPFLNEIVLLASIGIVIFVLYKILMFLNVKKFLLVGKRCSICSSTKYLGKCGKCGSYICRECFSKEGKCPHCHSNKFMPKT